MGDPTQQVHDWEPGVEPSGLFWTIRLDDDAVEAHPGSGEARLHATAGVRDFHDFFNAVTPGGASVPATVEFDVRWEGRGERSRIRDATFGFVGEFVAGAAHISFRATNGGVVYTSDSAGQYTIDGVQPGVGTERNGIFFH